MVDPAVPHLVVNSRALCFSWLPADPDAVAALVPSTLRPRPDRQVFMNQYVVDDESQTSGFGAHSLTYVGVSLIGLDAPGGETPGGWWTHYVASSEQVRRYALGRGAPVLSGRTSVEIRGGILVAETEVDGVPVIRATGQAGDTGHAIRSGHHRYVTTCDGQLISSIYPVVAEPATPFEIESVEFLQPGHPIYALRPQNPLTIAWGFYSPRCSFAYPGGMTVIGERAASSGARAAGPQWPAVGVVDQPVRGQRPRPGVPGQPLRAVRSWPTGWPGADVRGAVN